MKKISSILIMCIYTIVCSAQIQVASTGNVGIGDTLTTSEKLSVHVNEVCTTGISSKIENDEGTQIAIYGYAKSGEVKNTGRSYGVMAIAGNRCVGYNFGVYGAIKGENYGTAIYGTTSTIKRIMGFYAGYFHGDTYVTGTLTTGELTTLSDVRLKSDIQQINTTALTKITALNPVQYTMTTSNTTAPMNTEDSLSTTIMTTSNENWKNENRIHYGLLAQEVKELYPELVHEDGDGIMSINYIEIIPLLIQSVQDLSEQVSALSNSSSVSARKQTPKQQESTTESIAATLYQNTPNPFTEETVISYIVPTEAQQASIYIYNMLGEQLSKYDISVFGEGNVTISANELYAGTFLYSLVVDGKLIDTKQMIITQ